MDKEKLNKLLDDKKADSKVDNHEKQMGKNSRALLSGILLAFVGMLCVGIVLYASTTTRKIIAENEAKATFNMVSTLLPEEARVDNVKLDCYLVTSKLIGNKQTLYVATVNDEIKGYVLTYATALGYSNPLIMIAGFDKYKKVYKADIKFSQETPGLGDKVDRAHGNFLDQLSGNGLDDKNFEVKKFGGDFDFITGSTVTSRATVIATRDALKTLNEIDLDSLPKCKVR